MFLFAGKDKNIYIVNKEGNPINIIKGAHTEPINCLKSDGKLLISGSWDASAKIWDLETWECKATLPDHAHAVCACFVSEERILTGSQNKHI